MNVLWPGALFSTNGILVHVNVFLLQPLYIVASINLQSPTTAVRPWGAARPRHLASSESAVAMAKLGYIFSDAALSSPLNIRSSSIKQIV